MTREEKQLLLKDLCARLPYHPCINVCNDSWEGCQTGEFDTNLYSHHIDAFVCDRIEVKPYLRPMSSMTEEEEIMLDSMCNGVEMVSRLSGLKMFDKAFDLLYSKHLDIHGLIEKDLALEAPEGMYD